ncbi:MAG TPA: ATP-binding protein [Bryobacteraceae bacterium]|nr:ATP-binding protein [Bryobacteraceae bacterium]
MSATAKPESADSLVAELRHIPAFSDLAEDGIRWLASQMTVLELRPGEVLSEEGSPADRMFVILEGEIAGRSEGGNPPKSFTASAGQISGMLPYSRLTQFPLTTRAIVRSRVALLYKKDFDEMLRRMPELGPRLVGLLADRVREMTRADQQREKLMALGKLSAGLAHELNNPAAAARRAAADMREAFQAARNARLHLDGRGLSTEDRVFLAHLESDWEKNHPPQTLDSLERSDRVDEITAWLERRQIPEPWNLAASLVDASCEIATLDALAARFNRETLTDVLNRLTAAFTIARLTSEVENATARISELVRAIKEYSWMDQAPEQEVDVHSGIESTLIILKYRLKQGVNVVRRYDRTVPRVCALGSELNQVWTNLIDNAIDAMNGKGELTIRTAAELDRVLVEIRDNGSGIPPEIRGRIFDPFFTTKSVGEGTGLGLDAVWRIVQKHRGDVRVESRPGDTRFQVRLPAASTRKGEPV